MAHAATARRRLRRRARSMAGMTFVIWVLIGIRADSCTPRGLPCGPFSGCWRRDLPGAGDAQDLLTVADRVIFIIRHGEKPEGGDQGVELDGKANPDSLTPTGWQR